MIARYWWIVILVAAGAGLGRFAVGLPERDAKRGVLAVLGTVPIAAASALIAVQLFEAWALWIALPATFVVLGVGLVAALICAHLR
jgi:hypothetical protein